MFGITDNLVRRLSLDVTDKSDTVKIRFGEFLTVIKGKGQLKLTRKNPFRGQDRRDLASPAIHLGVHL